MRTNLKVPFAEKDEAKKLGARWDAARKLWYVENKDDMVPFARWMSGGNEPDATGIAKTRQPSIKKSHSEGITIVGSMYVEHPRVCECLPWDVCDLCRAFALNH
jgi:hypothetical protein